MKQTKDKALQLYREYLQGLEGFHHTAVMRFHDCMDTSKNEEAAVAMVERKFLEVAMALVSYSIMLEDRKTLKYEGQLNDKIYWLIRELEYTQATINKEVTK